MHAGTRIWTKICGITDVAMADVVVEAGADALGLMFAASVRQVDTTTASVIAARVRGRCQRVAIFVDAPAETVRSVLAAVEIDLLQFQGDENAAYCRQFGLPYVKAIRVRAPFALAPFEAEYADALALQLDTWVDGQAGGTGTSFEWSLWPAEHRIPLVLAGGLTPENVGAAVRRLRPWGVDVSGGVEGVRRGVKDAGRIRRFVAEVQRAGSE